MRKIRHWFKRQEEKLQEEDRTSIEDLETSAAETSAAEVKGITLWDHLPTVEQMEQAHEQSAFAYLGGPVIMVAHVREELARTYADAHDKIVRQHLVGGERNFQEGRRSAARALAVELGLLESVEDRAFELYRRAK